MVVAEALAHGLPVITTPNAGAADLIQESFNGWLVPAKDIERLAERLEWCIQHTSDVIAMRPNCLAKASSWGWRDFRQSFTDQLALKVSTATCAHA